jgi:hypothetical protein
MYRPITRPVREERFSESLTRRCFTEEATLLLGAEEEKPRGCQDNRLRRILCGATLITLPSQKRKPIYFA